MNAVGERRMGESAGGDLKRGPDVSCSARNAGRPERRLLVGFGVPSVVQVRVWLAEMCKAGRRPVVRSGGVLC